MVGFWMLAWKLEGSSRRSDVAAEMRIHLLEMEPETLPDDGGGGGRRGSETGGNGHNYKG